MKLAHVCVLPTAPVLITNVPWPLSAHSTPPFLHFVPSNSFSSGFVTTGVNRADFRGNTLGHGSFHTSKVCRAHPDAAASDDNDMKLPRPNRGEERTATPAT